MIQEDANFYKNVCKYMRWLKSCRSCCQRNSNVSDKEYWAVKSKTLGLYLRLL